MANGNPALSLVEPDPPPPAPDMAALGELVADLATCFGQGLIDYEARGVMALTTRWRAGDLFAKLYELQQSTIGKLDFEAAMHTQGKIVLARRLRAIGLCADLNSATIDAMHGEAISWISDILAKVTADERKRAN